MTKHPYPHDETRIIYVRGTDAQIGAQHAEQVLGPAKAGMLAFYERMWRTMVMAPPPGRMKRLVHRISIFALQNLVERRLRKKIPIAARTRLEATAAGLNLPVEQLYTSMLLPDLMPMMQALLRQVLPSKFVPVAAPRFGCTSFVIRGKEFLHGRNLDFPGVGYWDRYPVIQVTAPTSGLKYIGFTTAGVPFCGITGVNEAQISVSLHQHYCRKYSLGGNLPFIIGEQILNRATSLESALDILSRQRVATAWAFILTDGKTRESVIYECHPQAGGVHRLEKQNSHLAHSNFFQTADCKPSEYAVSARMNWDNHFRKTRLDALCEQAPQATVEDAVQWVSDHYDAFWGEEKIINRTVAQVFNIQSLVLDPVNMKVWMAEGDLPIQLRRYREYDLGNLFRGGEGKTENLIPAYAFKNPAKRAAKELYALSFVAAFDNDMSKAASYLTASIEKDFCPEIAYILALISLKAGKISQGYGHLKRGKEWIERRCQELSKVEFPPEYFEICLFLARSCDLLGERSQALTLYREIANHPALQDSHLRALAKTAGPYRVKHLAGIMTPYSSYIPFS